MAKNDNLVGQGFHTNPERIGGGRPKGVKNRSTILAEILALKPDGLTTNEYKIIDALVQKAQKGDVPAIQEIQNSMYGKIPDKLVTAETDENLLERDITDEVLKHVPTEVLEALMEKKNDE